MPSIIDLDTPPSSPRLKRQKTVPTGPLPSIATPSTSPYLPKASAASSLPSNLDSSPISTQFIADPSERVKQCVKVLCGNVGITADHFITLAIARDGIEKVTGHIMDMLDEGFFELLKLPQRARAEAAAAYLKPLEAHMSSTGIYLHTIKVPANATFWKEYEYAFDFDGIDTTKECVLAYIGSTVRSFHIRVEKEHMQKSYHEKHPCLHYAAMDEVGAQSKWFLLAATPSGTDRATTRILEALPIATMLTFQHVTYTKILRYYGIVESTAKAFGLNRTSAMRDWGMKTMDSTLQIVIYQRLLEEYGGEPWKLDMLPPVVADWYSPLDKELKDWIDNAVREVSSVSRALNSAMGKLGASACRDASIFQSVQKVLTGGQFRLAVASGGAGDVGFHVFNIGSIAVPHPCAKIDDYVSVTFIVSEGTHPLRYASDALQTDPGRRLAIFVTGQDSLGGEWNHFCKVKGDKAAMRANTYFDLITGTGVAMTEHHIPRRCYRVRSQRRNTLEVK